MSKVSQKSEVLNLRYINVCQYHKYYLKYGSQAINGPLDPLGGQNFQCFIKWDGLTGRGGVYWRFTHETEKDKTRNVLLWMTKLRISNLGISKTEKLVWENPTLIGKYLKSNYEKTKNWEFLKWEYCHKTYTSNLRERQNWEIEIPRIPISENWIYRNYIW